MGKQSFIVQADDVMPFAPKGREHILQSQVLIGPDGAGSEHIYLTRFTLLPGQELKGHAHAVPGSDEAYYILKGHGRLDLAPESGSPERVEHKVGPGTVVFIPAGTFHRLDNTDSTEPLVLLTIWNEPPAPGSNGINDARLEAWGTTFRLRGQSNATTG